MNNKDYKYYFPIYFSQDNGFLTKLKNPEKFQDYSMGPMKHWYKDESNYGVSRQQIKLSEYDKLSREYVWHEFQRWREWVNAGRQIFSFSEELLIMLSETDVDEVLIELIKLPYKNFYVSLKELKIPFSNDAKDGLIDGFYVSEEINTEYDDVTYEKVLAFHFVGDYKKLYLKFGNHISLDFFDASIKNYRLYLDKPEGLINVKQAIEDDRESFRLWMYDEGEEKTETKEEIIQTRDTLINNTIRIAINCLLYLSLPDNNLEREYGDDLPLNLKDNLKKADTKKRKERAENEIIELGYTRINFLGRKFHQNLTRTTTNGTINTHWRRGHWRNQKHGENLSLNKLIWIMPTLVNKELGTPQLGHEYRVE